MPGPEANDSTSPQQPSSRRLLWVVLIAAFGGLIALPFRHPDRTANGSDDPSHPGSVSRFARSSDVTGPPTMPGDSLPPSLPFVGSALDKDPQVASDTRPLLERVPEPIQTRAPIAPPTIPAAYEPLVSAEGTSPAFLAHDDEDSANILPQHLRELSTSQRWPVQQSATAKAPSDATRQYRIRDGDTLASIAQRYLGDYRRAGEIYELNRERLPRHDMLPLGEIILIPR